MKRILWYTLSALLLFGMGRSILGLVSRGAPTIPRPPDVAKAERVIVPPAGTPEDIPDFRDPIIAAGAGTASVVGGNGVVEPDREEVKVAGEIAGRVAEVLVREGQRVDAGAPLVRLEDGVAKAAAAVAEAELEAAKARRDKVLKGNRAEDVRAAIAAAREADSRAALAKTVLERTKRLVEGSAATEDELERARREAEATSFAASAADARKSAVVNGSRAEDIAEAEAAVRVAEARAAETRARLDERTIRAPIAGEVLQVKIRPGEHYQPGEVAPLVLGDTRRLTVRVDVDERDFARVEVGAEVKVMAKAFGDRVFVGKVRELGRRMGRKNLRTDDPAERNDTKILEVVVALDGDTKGLLVGQRVTALISAPAVKSAGR
jgi:HlyD family secretion protein